MVKIDGKEFLNILTGIDGDGIFVLSNAEAEVVLTSDVS
jgi:hypothetical protein